LTVFDGVPRTKQQIDATAGGMAGEAKREANKTKVYYGLLKEPDLNVTLEDEDEAQETEDKPKKKKTKKESQLNKKQKHDPHAPQLTRIPLPEL
jgi:transcription initiation factor TFIID subunit 5